MLKSLTLNEITPEDNFVSQGGLHLTDFVITVRPNQNSKNNPVLGK